MQTQTSIYIPKPCHEDWNEMTPTQQGKFCASCNKQVIDFSLMSDRQILNFIAHQSGTLCGRFDAEQLQRPLIEPKIKKKKNWWMALTMPLLFLFDKSEAQKIIPDTTISPIFKQPDIMGKLSYQPANQKTVTGKVLDTDNKPIAYATIMLKGTKHGTVSDSSGNFSININTEESITLVASFVGFETIEKRMNISDSNIIMKMQSASASLKEVVVV